MKYILVVGLCISFVSCYTAKSVEQDMKTILDKYDVKYDLSKVDFKKLVEETSRETINRGLDTLEFVHALSPDSISQTGDFTDHNGFLVQKRPVIDSIYWNEHKIRYIKKNRLQTPHIKFISR